MPDNDNPDTTRRFSAIPYPHVTYRLVDWCSDSTEYTLKVEWDDVQANSLTLLWDDMFREACRGCHSMIPEGVTAHSIGSEHFCNSCWETLIHELQKEILDDPEPDTTDETT